MRYRVIILLILLTVSVGYSQSIDDGKTAVANSWSTFADGRFKTDVTQIADAKLLVLRLRGVNYIWKKNGMTDIGFIAQEVEEVLPEIVQTSEEGYKSVDYARVTAVLVEAIKDLNAENEKLREEINNFKQKGAVNYNSLMRRIERLENQQN